MPWRRACSGLRAGQGPLRGRAAAGPNGPVLDATGDRSSNSTKAIRASSVLKDAGPNVRGDSPTLNRAPIAPEKGYYCDSARWDSFVPREGDIVIATAPKVGPWGRLDAVAARDPDLPAPTPRPPRDTRGFFNHWINPGGTASAELMADAFFEIERTFWAERARPNVLLLHYNDMKADLDGEMRRIAAFLGIPVDEAVWPELVAAADFSAMRRDGGTLMAGVDVAFEGGHTIFLNKEPRAAGRPN